LSIKPSALIFMWYFITCFPSYGGGHFISFQKQEKYKGAELSAGDLFKKTHYSKKKGFTQNVQKAIVSTCFHFYVYTHNLQLVVYYTDEKPLY
jgi:hypothetical protein